MKLFNHTTAFAIVAASSLFTFNVSAIECQFACQSGFNMKTGQSIKCDLANTKLDLWRSAAPFYLSNLNEVNTHTFDIIDQNTNMESHFSGHFTDSGEISLKAWGKDQSKFKSYAIGISTGQVEIVTWFFINGQSSCFSSNNSHVNLKDLNGFKVIYKV